MPRPNRLFFLIACLLTTAAHAAIFRPFLVKDIATAETPGSSYPTQFTVSGSKLFFRAFTPETGTELWVTDGTSGGTHLVSDIMPGYLSGLDYGFPLVPYKGGVVFMARDPEHGRELWKSDGTFAGTVLIKDVAEGAADSFPFQVVAAGDTLFIHTAPPTGFDQLWVSDATAEGTRRVDALPNILSLAAATDSYALAGTPDALYRIDASTAAVTQLTQLPASASLQTAPLAGGVVLFLRGSRLYRTDGTPAGTQLVKSFIPAPVTLKRCGAVVYVVVSGPGTNTESLWVTDGTDAGTQKLSATLFAPQAMTPFGDKMIFTALSSGHRDVYLTDGTAAGTVDVTNGHPPIPDDLGAVHTTIAVLNGRAYFPAGALNTTAPPELWRTDGSPAGTERVATFNSSIASGAFFFPEALAAFNGAVYFAASDATAGREPFRSDGTAAGTAVLRDIVFSDTSSQPNALTPALGALFFFADLPEGGAALWRSRGSDTRMLKAIGAPVTFAADPPKMYGECEHLLYFAARQINGPVQVWRTDGTAGGTVPVWTASSVTGNASASGACTANGMLFGTNDNFTNALKITHGTAESTATVRPMFGFHFHATSYGAIFSALDDDGSTLRVWRTDGTAAGTAVVSKAVAIRDVTTDLFAGSRLAYFVGIVDDQYGLWRTDGTAAGTIKLRSLSGSSDVALAGVIDDALYFTGGHGLWRSDGTADGTQLLASFPNPAVPEVVKMGGAVYFAAPVTPSIDVGLWRTDGTAAGTVPVFDPLTTTYGLGHLTVVDHYLFFVANLAFSLDETNRGMELYVYDGSSTTIAADIAPGRDGSSPDNLTALGNALYFTAGNRLGVELWSIWTSEPPRIRAAGK